MQQIKGSQSSFCGLTLFFYNWNGYKRLFQMVRELKLKLQDYESKRNYIVKLLASIGFQCQFVSKGSFFVFAELPESCILTDVVITSINVDGNLLLIGSHQKENVQIQDFSNICPDSELSSRDNTNPPITRTVSIANEPNVFATMMFLPNAPIKRNSA